MAVTAAALTTPVRSGLIPGLGFKTMLAVTWDASYAAGPGETLDLSAFFPTEVFGGAVYGDTLNDGGYECVYVRGTAGDPATGAVEAWYTNNDAGGVQDPLIEVAGAVNLSAMDAQRWMFWGH